MYLELLDLVRVKLESYGDPMRPPCSSDELSRLRRETSTKLGVSLPLEYTTLLQITDGLIWNGLCIMASRRSIYLPHSHVWIDGFIERNLEEREWDVRMCEYIVFAEDGEVSFALNIPSSNYEIVSRVGRSVDHVFDSFDELISSAFEAHL